MGLIPGVSIMWISSLGQNRVMIGLYQGISTIKSSKTGKGLSIMVDSDSRPSRRRERQRRHAPIIQYLPSLMVFLGKERHKYPSIPTRTNSVSTWSGMECGVSSPFQTHAINIRSGIFLYISLYFSWATWNATYRVFRKALMQMSMWFRTWRGQ